MPQDYHSNALLSTSSLAGWASVCNVIHRLAILETWHCFNITERCCCQRGWCCKARSGVAPANQTKEKAKPKSSWISPIFVNSGVFPWENKHDSHWTFVPECPGKSSWTGLSLVWFAGATPDTTDVNASKYAIFLATHSSCPQNEFLFNLYVLVLLRHTQTLWQHSIVKGFLRQNLQPLVCCYIDWEVSLDGKNRQSPIASVQRTLSTLASHSAVPRGTNVKRVNANRAIQIAAQRTQGLWGLISLVWGEIWPPTNASDSNRSDDSR